MSLSKWPYGTGIERQIEEFHRLQDMARSYSPDLGDVLASSTSETLRRLLGRSDSFTLAEQARLLGLTDPHRESSQETALRDAIRSATDHAGLRGATSFSELAKLGASNGELRHLAAEITKGESDYTEASTQELRRMEVARLIEISALGSHGSELSRLAQAHLDSFKIPGELNRFRRQTEEVMARMERITAPWIKTRDPIASIEGFAELSATAAALRSSMPFAPALSATLRGHLGDWRGISLTPEILSNTRAFNRLLDQVGFDRRLIAFPNQAYMSVLDIAGMPAPRPYADYVRRFEPRPLRRQQLDKLPKHLIKAFAAGFILEQKMRVFINMRMIEVFGPNWVVERVSATTRRKWERTKKREATPEEQDEPLIIFADLSDCPDMILAPEHWNKVFEAYFEDPAELRAVFEAVKPVRNRYSHSRPPSRAACLLHRTAAYRLLTAIEEFESDDDSEKLDRDHKADA